MPEGFFFIRKVSLLTKSTKISLTELSDNVETKEARLAISTDRAFVNWEEDFTSLFECPVSLVRVSIADGDVSILAIATRLTNVNKAIVGRPSVVLDR